MIFKLNDKVRIATIAASGLLILQSFVPTLALAQTEGVISGNGAESVNEIEVTQSVTRTISQTNELNLVNELEVIAETGENEANENTGGNVRISTGDASVDARIQTMANFNKAAVGGDQSNPDYSLQISGNGAESENEIEVDSTRTIELTQDNLANVENEIEIRLQTGENEANENTGGSVVIETGDARVTRAEITSSVNANVASIDMGEGDDFLAKISGNGAESENEIDLALLNEVLLDQTNDAEIENEIEIIAETGENEANENTGTVHSDPEIRTGDATAYVLVDTAANFNAAKINGFAADDRDFQINGNGVESENEVEYDLTDIEEVLQDNLANVDNEDLFAYLGTGENETEENTSEQVNSITTGDTSYESEVATRGNVNILGEDEGADWDGWWNRNVHFTFDMSHMFSFFSDRV